MNLGDLLQLADNWGLLNEIKAHRDGIVPFVGAGVSCDCGLYAWGELIGRLERKYLKDDELQVSDEMSLLDRAQRIVDRAGNARIVMKSIRRIFEQADVRRTELPYLLVSHFSQMLVTTNYDCILEDASQRSPQGKLVPLLPCLESQVNDAIQLNGRSLLKIHGSLEEVTSFVFTRQQYLDFYGTRGGRGEKLVPEYLKRIFVGKRVLFVGCSLEEDIVLDILEECVEENGAITHYAIVPLPASRDKQIERKNSLSRFGIEAIFYPEGDYEAVHKLIYYLTEDNSFIRFVRGKLSNICENENQIESLVNVFKGSLLKASVRYPQLLGIDNLGVDYDAKFDSKRNKTDTVFGVCKDLLGCYVQLGHLGNEGSVIESVVDCFERDVLRETDIEPLLEKKWSLSRRLPDLSGNECEWILDLSLGEFDEYATELCGKLQYGNGMSFAVVQPFYREAKNLLELAPDKISFLLKITLMNNVAAFGHYFKDTKYAICCLEACIKELEEVENQSSEILRLKAKCYANLAINESLCDGFDIYTVLKHAKHDIDLKKSCGEKDWLLSRSLSFYATVLKEVDPFLALDVYLECEETKRKSVIESSRLECLDERVASWATTVFNIGLLAKDLGIYDLAYKLVAYANQRRFRAVNPANRDYCSSLNVSTELELLIGKPCILERIIRGVEVRVDLPIGFAETQAHTWYVCALYYHSIHDDEAALRYLEKADYASREEGAPYDFRQSARIKLLRADVTACCDDNEASRLYGEVIDSIDDACGPSSYYLIAPLRHCIINLTDPEEDVCNRLRNLEEQYEEQLVEARAVLWDFLEELPPDLGIV